MTRPTRLLYVTPHPARTAGLPSRPRALLEAIIATGAFREIMVVNRVRPSVLVRARMGRLGIDLARRSTLAPGVTLIEHAWPFGPLESRALARMVDEAQREDQDPLVVWVADPKAGRLFERLAGSHGVVTVFDAYDAWDLSPLVVGRVRAKAVRRGYAAASRVDLVFANTSFMAKRLRTLGARDVRLLPNGAPSISPSTRASTEVYLLYVGRIHERVDTDLLMAVADAYPRTPLRIVGPLEREPVGWRALLGRPSVGVEPAVVGLAAMDLIAEAQVLLLPHVVDDYTRSQDAMKAWDALAMGTPIVGTALSPLIDWPTGTAIVASDRQSFVEGVGRALAGELDAGRDARIEFARGQGWDARAATAIAAIIER